MKKYMAIFLGVANDPTEMEKWNAMPEAERKAVEQQGMQAWGKWAEENKDAIVDAGSPLGKTKQTSTSGVSDTKNAMAAWTIVQAESHEDAAKLFLNHPHFTIFPGKSVEIMECLPMPSM
jgi:hypothetical protein